MDIYAESAREAAAEAMRPFGFSQANLKGWTGTAQENLVRLADQISRLDLELGRVRADLTAMAPQREQLRRCADRAAQEIAKEEAKARLVDTADTFFLEGWAPTEDVPRLDAALAGFDCAWEFSEPAPEEYPQVPVKLKNNWLFRPFEMFVDMFGLPSYREIDPTGFVAITYAILFGIMFGDFGQGLLVIGVGAFMWKKMKMKLGPILMRVGIFSSLFGLIYGEVFGFEGVLDGVYENLLGVEPFKVMEGEHIIIILLSAVGLGVLMAIVSMILNIYSALRRRDFEAGLFGPSGVAGLGFYTSLSVGALLQMVLQIPVMNVAYILLLIVLPLFCIFFRGPLSDLISGKKNWMPEQIGGYIVENFFEMFEFLLSYFTNTLSFLRVGAFALVHAGMMMVVFTIAGLFGPIGYTITAIIGNVIVSALEGLLVGIQVLRLEYYEMFSRFYEGGGRPFRTVKNLRNVE